jgi:hypothetical protein
MTLVANKIIICLMSLVVVLINVKSLTTMGFVKVERINWTKKDIKCA